MAPHRTTAALAVLFMVPILILLIGAFVWFGCRIEPGNGEIAVLIRKTGKDLPPGDIIAPDPSYKGIQKEVLGEGRYFYNPYTYTWQLVKVTDIPAGKFGVLVRKYGKDLPAGEIIAADAESKGIVNEVLGTGKHRINPYAYDIKLCDDIKIQPGTVGVVTSLCGGDIFSGKSYNVGHQRGFVTEPGLKGVQGAILKAGTHRINPFIESITVVNIQSQRHEFSGEDAISFLTMDGFNISLEGTVEFNIIESEAARLLHEVGNMDDILKKLILPSVSGFARIEGSKKTATEFIIGESRQVFQDQLEEFLMRNCSNWGVSINSVLIRDIIPPQDISEIIRNRELAKQEAKKIEQQIVQARSAVELAKQKMLALQTKAIVDADTTRITEEISVKQQQMERQIAAKTELEVALLQMKSVELESEGKHRRVEAQKEVIDYQNQLDIQELTNNLEIYGSSEAYLRAMLYRKVAPRIESVMTTAVPDGLFGLPFSSVSTKSSDLKAKDELSDPAAEGRVEALPAPVAKPIESVPAEVLQ